MSTPTIVTFTHKEIVQTYNKDNNKNEKEMNQVVKDWFIENLEHMGWQDIVPVEGGLKASLYEGD